MDSYPNYNPEDERSYPAAPKGGSGPEGAPLGPVGPDHNPPSGGYFPNDEQWAGGAAFPLSSPYTGMSSGEPPAPIFRPELDSPGVARGGFPSRTDVGARSKPTNRRRILAGLAAFLLLVLVVGGLAFVLLGGGGGDGHPTANGGNNNNGGGAPVIVGTDTPTPTPTLLPGQTPLPTAIPATPTPKLAPGQPTPTPIPYASSASVSFTRATQSANLPSSTLTASTGGGQIAAHAANASMADSVGITSPYDPGTPVVVSLTVKNGTGGPLYSPYKLSVISSKESIPCTIQNPNTVPAGGQISQTCYTNNHNYTSGSFDDTTSNPGLEYIGSIPVPNNGHDPFFFVPQNCTTAYAGAVQADVKSKLQQTLGVPGGSSVFYDSGVSYGTVSCNPSYQYENSTSFNIDVGISTSSWSQTYYNPGDAINYQKSHVSAGAGWQLLSSGACGSPSNSGASQSSVTITCPATGTEAWNAFDLGGMAALIHGQTQATAKGELNAVQGVVANSETFSLSGGSYLPTNASNISFHYTP